MRHLIIGMGQVGNGIFNVLKDVYIVFSRDKKPAIISVKIDVLHICIPYSEEFEESVKKYIKLYKPKLTIVYSSTKIGTCEKLGVIHSPIEGKHPQLGLSIRNSARWLGSSNEKNLGLAAKIWEKIVPVRRMESANFTEWLKLRSTSKYGINIVWADYEAGCCEKLGLDFSAVRQFDMDYNEMYKRMGMLQFQRYILDPPNGKIGGHCIVPNAELLNEDYPDDMLDMIMEMK